MKKFIFSSLFLLAFVGLSQAQTTDTQTKATPKVEAANPAVKSCCAPKADNTKTSCAKDEAQVKACCASKLAETGKQCCAKDGAKAEASTEPSKAATAAPAEKPQAVAAGATRSSGKKESAPAEIKAVQL